MSKGLKHHDPRGHSLRVYSDVYDSPAFKALSAHDVMAYLALLRELKGFNNGNLSLPLTRAKTCGISHPKTLARSLRAICAVGLVAVSRRGGCTKGGQRLPNLFRMTDRDCFAIPAKHLEAMPATNEWKRVASVEHGHKLIEDAESAALGNPAKLKTQGHAVTATGSPDALVSPEIVARREPWTNGPGHAVNMAENDANPMSARVSGQFQASTGTLIRPTPSSPMVNSRKANWPASGFSALAASVAVSILVMPCTCRVTAVARMMK